MVGWHTLLLTLLTVAAVACSGIALICLLASRQPAEVVDRRAAIREARIFGLCGLLLFAAIAVVKL